MITNVLYRWSACCLRPPSNVFIWFFYNPLLSLLYITSLFIFCSSSAYIISSWKSFLVLYINVSVYLLPSLYSSPLRYYTDVKLVVPIKPSLYPSLSLPFSYALSLSKPVFLNDISSDDGMLLPPAQAPSPIFHPAAVFLNEKTIPWPHHWLSCAVPPPPKKTRKKERWW